MDSKTNERWLSLFERKAFQCIFGAKQENETWRKRCNYELHEALNDDDDNNNNNNNIYLPQFGCHPVAVVILHVNKTRT